MTPERNIWSSLDSPLHILQGPQIQHFPQRSSSCPATNTVLLLYPPRMLLQSLSHAQSKFSTCLTLAHKNPQWSPKWAPHSSTASHLSRTITFTFIFSAPSRRGSLNSLYLPSSHHCFHLPKPMPGPAHSHSQKWSPRPVNETQPPRLDS